MVDLDDLYAPSDFAEDAPVPSDPPKLQPGKPPKRTRPFLKYIDWQWVKASMRLGGSACAVGIALWYFSGLQKSKQMGVTKKRLASEVGCDRTTVGRALKMLETAGLIQIQRAPGRKLVILLIAEVEPAGDAVGENVMS